MTEERLERVLEVLSACGDPPATAQSDVAAPAEAAPAAADEAPGIGSLRRR